MITDYILHNQQKLLDFAQPATVKSYAGIKFPSETSSDQLIEESADLWYIESC